MKLNEKKIDKTSKIKYTLNVKVIKNCQETILKGDHIMFEKMKALIADQLGVEEDKITMEASFKDDLEADSLDLFELVMGLEDEYNIEIPTDDLEEIKTVGDFVEYMKLKGIE
jgi:acyl carrier protein